MRIAVSGADGFLGTHVLDYLRFEGAHEVVGITMCPDELCARYPGWEQLTIVPAAQITADADSALDNVDAYLACAFPRAAGQEGFAEGLSFVYKSLAVLVSRGCRSVVNISSQSVYDPHRVKPAHEDDGLLLTTAYAATKYCVELSVAQICNDMRVPWTSIRMASLIGPGFDARFVNKMVIAALETHEITVADNGSSFGFLDVRDAAEGLVRLLESNPERWDKVYNLGPRVTYGISQVAAVVASEVEHISSDMQRVIVKETAGEGIPSCSAVDSSSLYAFLNWEPRYELTASVYTIIGHEVNSAGNLLDQKG